MEGNKMKLEEIKKKYPNGFTIVSRVKKLVDYETHIPVELIESLGCENDDWEVDDLINEITDLAAIAEDEDITETVVSSTPLDNGQEIKDEHGNIIG
jgi:hypothetical protein